MTFFLINTILWLIFFLIVNRYEDLESLTFMLICLIVFILPWINIVAVWIYLNEKLDKYHSTKKYRDNQKRLEKEREKQHKRIFNFLNKKIW